MSERARVLCVDDEPNVLSSLRRTLRRDFDVEVESDPGKALERLRRDESFAVVVSDLRMPGMDGIAFLTSVETLSSESARILLTGNADLEVAIDAINDGNIFRFLRKPCPPEVLIPAIQAGARHFELTTSEKVLLEKTLNGCVQMLMEVLSISNEAAFGRAMAVRRVAAELAQAVGLDDPWSLEVAAMLSQTGSIAVPGHVIEKAQAGGQLTGDEREMLKSIPTVAASLIGHIPRMESVVGILENLESQEREAVTPLSSRLLRAALEYVRLGATVGVGAALEAFRGREVEFGKEVLTALRTVASPDGAPYEQRSIAVREIRPEMILVDDVTTESGLLVVARGNEVTRGLMIRIRNFTERMSVVEPIRVRVPIRDDRPQSGATDQPGSARPVTPRATPVRR